MGMLIEGVWHGEGEFHDADGRFRRQVSQFRAWVSSEEGALHPPEQGRYHLYVSAACPWAHRTLIVRALLGLEDCISVSEVAPLMLADGWIFDQAHPDPLHQRRQLHEVYCASMPKYTGRVTVPVLYDRQRNTIVNNESSEIIRMLNGEFRSWSNTSLDLYPAPLRPEIDQMNARTYESINNGVYKAGFAATQDAYEQAVTTLFETLDSLESHLQSRQYLVGDQLTEADIRLFTTLARFDPVYLGHFKCNLRALFQYPNLYAYTRRFYHLPKVAETCNLDDIKTHYYGSHPRLNPSGVIPRGPLRWLA